MDDRRRQFLVEVSPWVGFAAAAAALALAPRAVSAGLDGAGVVGYAAGAAELLAGYVTARRAWDREIDATFVAGLVAVVLVSAFILVALALPPSVFA
ncbi:MAG: hypothetical protein ABEJ26_11645 [Halosimplex sp.]